MEIDLERPGELTLDSVRRLIASESDATHTQLRVTKDGVAFISTTDIGGSNVDGLAFCVETWSAGADYVGPDAAQDTAWVERVYRVLRDNWPNPTSPYIDMY